MRAEPTGKMTHQEVFDAHCHIVPQAITMLPLMQQLDEEIRPNRKCSAEDLIELMDRAIISEALVLLFPTREFAKYNRDFLAQVKLFTPRLSPCSILDERAEEWIALGACCIKEHIYGLRTKNDPSVYLPQLKVCACTHTPLLTHLGGNASDSLEEHYSAVANRVLYYKEECPSLSVIVAHAGLRFSSPNWCCQWEHCISSLQQMDSVYVDISGITSQQALKEIIEIMGGNRVLFGSDFPYEAPSAVLDRLSVVPLTEDVRQQITFGNAKRLFCASS